MRHTQIRRSKKVLLVLLVLPFLFEMAGILPASTAQIGVRSAYAKEHGEQITPERPKPELENDNDTPGQLKPLQPGDKPRIELKPPTATPRQTPPTATPEPPTATPEPPTATPEPPTATPEPPTATPEPPTATPEPPTDARIADRDTDRRDRDRDSAAGSNGYSDCDGRATDRDADGDTRTADCDVRADKVERRFMEADEYTDEGRGQFAADGYTDCDTDADRHTDSATRANSNSDIGAADCDADRNGVACSGHSDAGGYSIAGADRDS